MVRTRLRRLGALWPQARSLLVPALMAATALGVVLLFPRESGTGTRRTFPITPPATAQPAQIKVYIAGAVQQPGVYTLTEGERVDALLRLAGGPAPDADLEAVNLAAHLRDAQQVIIPRQGQAAPPDDTAPPGGLTDINTASQAQLEALPDIGPVRAQRIIDSRTQDGPFRDPHDLVTRKIITERIFDKLRDRVTAR
ncbi:MAG: ComEA family DNA-binding protein [Chloroflexi bacterium]|nr:ComEA family DNA-binding protein [Chloroflexota bacterium]